MDDCSDAIGKLHRARRDVLEREKALKKAKEEAEKYQREEAALVRAATRPSFFSCAACKCKRVWLDACAQYWPNQ